jgi:hypothetical protein
VAVRGEKPWPSAGNSGGRPRGIPVAAYGEIAMAVDTLPMGMCGRLPSMPPAPCAPTR